MRKKAFCTYDFRVIKKEVCSFYVQNDEKVKFVHKVALYKTTFSYKNRLTLCTKITNLQFCTYFPE